MNTVSDFKGLYVAPEAAIYLTATLKYDVNRAISKNINVPHPKYPINSRNLIRWIRVGLSSPDLKTIKGSELLVSFEDLISMRIISILRALGVSWAKIHRAEKWLRERTGYPRPFAIERVWTETEDVFAEFHDTFITASRHGQLVFADMLGKYLQPVEDMTFMKHDGVCVADKWMPHEDIIINPKIQFGEPCIRGTRIRTRVIHDYILSGETTSYLIRTFNITNEQINHALEWENRLQSARSN